MQTFVNYVNDAISELRHVRWPTRQQAIRLSLIVIVFIIINAIVFGFVDYLLAQAVRALINLTTVF